MPTLPTLEIKHDRPDQLILYDNVGSSRMIGGFFFLMSLGMALSLSAPELMGRTEAIDGASWPFALMCLLASSHLFFRGMTFSIDGRTRQIRIESKLCGVIPRCTQYTFDEVSAVTLERDEVFKGGHNNTYSVYIAFHSGAEPQHVDSSWDESAMLALQKKITAVLGLSTGVVTPTRKEDLAS